MLKTIETLIERLNREGVRYCHWKSNWVLAETLMGNTDIDLLVHHHDARRFRAILRDLGFEPSIEAGVPSLPSVEHHHALDAPSCDIVHVHAYYRIITGQSLAKNYRLPIEEMLLANLRQIGIVNVPTAGAELIVFVLRMLIKHTSAVELLLLGRDWQALHQEAAWLMSDASLHEATKLLETWLPGLDDRFFEEAFETLSVPTPLWRRILMGYRVRLRLRRFARRSAFRAWLVELSKFVAIVQYRLTGSKRKLTPAGGGAVIAFVGSEATGKTTVLDDTQTWLGRHYTVYQIHTGRPPGTFATSLLHHLLPTLRTLFPAARSTAVEYRYAEAVGPSRTFPLIFGLRSVMLAYERKALLTKAFAKAANGTIVLSDRYPSMVSGAPDSPQLRHLPQPAGPLSVRRWLVATEDRLYRETPPPDLVIHLVAPLEVTLARNAARDKTEPEKFVRMRHLLAGGLRFDGVPTYRIDTDRPFETIIRDVRRAIWTALYGSQTRPEEAIADLPGDPPVPPQH